MMKKHLAEAEWETAFGKMFLITYLISAALLT